MPKQEFDNWDLWAGAICFGLFMAFVLITSCTCINYCCVRDEDELTKMEIWGAEHKVRLRLGPHSEKTLEKKMVERIIE
ncbi:unnamed protein product [Caenorhabditis sp. 36 PRJEB53466]|nr:unnamed protein product [Caenorhabditis sp. 36 PRJEB53466]